MLIPGLDLIISRKSDHDQRAAPNSASESCRGKPASQSSLPVREPFEGIANAGAIDAAGTGTSQGGPNIEQGQGIGNRVQGPCRADQDAATKNHVARTETVDQVTFDRHQPGFDQYEEAERYTGSTPCPQWCLASVGPTKRVHPYCRFATLAMQTTPITNCIHRLANTDFPVSCCSITTPPVFPSLRCKSASTPLLVLFRCVRDHLTASAVRRPAVCLCLAGPTRRPPCARRFQCMPRVVPRAASRTSPRPFRRRSNR